MGGCLPTLLPGGFALGDFLRGDRRGVRGRVVEAMGPAAPIGLLLLVALALRTSFGALAFWGEPPVRFPVTCLLFGDTIVLCCGLYFLDRQLRRRTIIAFFCYPTNATAVMQTEQRTKPAVDLCPSKRGVKQSRLFPPLACQRPWALRSPVALELLLNAVPLRTVVRLCGVSRFFRDAIECRLPNTLKLLKLLTLDERGAFLKSTFADNRRRGSLDRTVASWMDVETFVLPVVAHSEVAFCPPDENKLSLVRIDEAQVRRSETGSCSHFLNLVDWSRNCDETTYNPLLGFFVRPWVEAAEVQSNLAIQIGGAEHTVYDVAHRCVSMPHDPSMGPFREVRFWSTMRISSCFCTASSGSLFADCSAISDRRICLAGREGRCAVLRETALHPSISIYHQWQLVRRNLPSNRPFTFGAELKGGVPPPRDASESTMDLPIGVYVLQEMVHDCQYHHKRTQQDVYARLQNWFPARLPLDECSHKIPWEETSWNPSTLQHEVVAPSHAHQVRRKRALDLEAQQPDAPEDAQLGFLVARAGIFSTVILQKDCPLYGFRIAPDAK